MPETTRSNFLGYDQAEAPTYEGYEVIRRLGVGAGSVIYLVKSKATGETFALKHVERMTDKDKRLIEQVENEYNVARQVDYPYVRKVFEIKRVKKLMQTREVFMLMEYCPGQSLENSTSRSLLDLLLIFRMVANGLNGMHSFGMLHCDMKPNNIIIADDGGIRIIDLGQSCPIGTVKARIQGTPDYIAPEQVKRKPLVKQTDVFNLGATMYWAFTGKKIPTMIPPKRKDRVEIASERNVGPTPSPHELKSGIPIGVSNLIMDCVKKQIHERPADMVAVISRLDLLIHMIAGGKAAKNDS